MHRGGRMENLFGFEIRLVRSLRGVIPTKKLTLPVDSYSCGPVFTLRVPKYSKVTATVSLLGASLVVHIFLSGYNAQIRNSVVVAHPIDMVNVSIGPLSMEYAPSHSVGTKFDPLVFEYNVPPIGCVFNLFRWVGGSVKSARFRLVQQFAKVNIVHPNIIGAI